MKNKGFLSRALSKVAGSKPATMAVKIGGIAAFAAAANGCTLTVAGPQNYEIDCYSGTDPYTGADYYDPYDCVTADDVFVDRDGYNTLMLHGRIVSNDTPASECTVYVARPGDYCF